MPEHTQTPNRLINETSPYLLQHAYNPVNWYPWGEEAFKKADEEGKPVFLSIGYSTCHWCHVMERESFEDGGVAEILNNNFVPVKVDREERPEIDAVYMSVCQALTGSGGWPLTIIMTPDKKPFFAGTYLPKNNKYGRTGLTELLGIVLEKWRGNNALLQKSAGEIAAHTRKWQDITTRESGGLNARPFISAYNYFAGSFDGAHGGFGGAPKFPTPHNLMFLMRYTAAENNKTALYMAEHTLLSMYRGGIFDHIGYGFSRYSTDNEWLAPHFEKMLYDNALLTITYLECYQLTGKNIYREIAEKILAYVSREMTSSEGGFYSAQDADSGGVEGAYYLFSPREVAAVLGGELGKRFCSLYDVTEKGNFEKLNIPNLLKADSLELPEEIKEAAEKLYRYRSERVKLFKDDKILTAWNGLMIAAYAKAYRVTGNEAYLAAAQKAYSFIKQNLFAGGELRVSYRGGKASGDSLLDNYAFLIWALLELYDASFDISYLAEAAELAKYVISAFANDGGGYYMTQEGSESLIYRPQETYDGAMPSGNSVFAYCLNRLADLTGDEQFENAAEKQTRFLQGVVSQNGAPGHTFALLALMQKFYPSKQLVCLVNGNGSVAEIISALGKKFLPELSVLAVTKDNYEECVKLCGKVKNFTFPGSGNVYYLCRNNACSAPVTDINLILAYAAEQK